MTIKILIKDGVYVGKDLVQHWLEPSLLMLHCSSHINLFLIICTDCNEIKSNIKPDMRLNKLTHFSSFCPLSSLLTDYVRLWLFTDPLAKPWLEVKTCSKHRPIVWHKSLLLKHVNSNYNIRMKLPAKYQHNKNKFCKR